jgi:hypothetical protein
MDGPDRRDARPVDDVVRVESDGAPALDAKVEARLWIPSAPQPGLTRGVGNSP